MEGFFTFSFMNLAQSPSLSQKKKTLMSNLDERAYSCRVRLLKIHMIF